MKKLIRETIAPCTVLAVLALASAASFAEEVVANLEPPVLRDVMWQVLPEKVLDATVGPDGRVWWEVRRPPGGMRYEDMRGVIEEQFHSESPVLAGARPILFEPGGRAWFSFFSGSYLCAYDGNRWIELKEERHPRSWGVCVGHGRRVSSGYNYIIQGKAFFQGGRGVYVFEPETEMLSFQLMGEGFTRRYLLPEPDGAGIVAYYASSRKAPVLWRWRDGEWTQIALPTGFDSLRIAGMAAAENGIWIDEQDTRDTRYRAKKPENPPRTGLRFIPFDPEGFEEDKEQDVDKHFAAGPYTVKGVMLDSYDTLDTTYVRAKEIRKVGKSLGPGMLIKRRDGVHALLGARFAESWEQRRYLDEPDSGPILVAEKQAVWFPGRKGGEPAQLYSLKNGSLIATMREENFRWLHAVLPDGTVIARSGGGRPTGRLTSAAFKPGAPDDRKFLDYKKTEFCLGPIFCAAPDGTVWAQIAEKRDDGEERPRTGTIARFDGEQWRPIEQLRGTRSVYQFLPGRNGEILMRASRGFYFMIGDKFYRQRNLEALIAEHREEFAAAYFMGVAPRRSSRGPYPKGFRIVADKAGNVWLHTIKSDDDSLKVLAGDTWLDAEPALRKMGPDSRLKFITGLGDGRMLYLTDFRSARDKGVSCYAEVSNGEVVLAPAPRCEDSGKHRTRVTDHDKALWVMSRPPAGERRGRPVYRKALFRLFGDREQEVTFCPGYPALCDATGNVWLWSSFPGHTSSADIWSEGKVRHTVRMPGVPRHLFSDRPGSVFAFGSAGISHLTAEDPNDPAKYTVKALYAIDGLKGEVQCVDYSSLGYMVVSAEEYKPDERAGMRPRHFLYLIKLPKPEDE